MITIEMEEFDMGENKNNNEAAKKKEEDNPFMRTKMCQRCKRMFYYSGFGHIYCDYCKRADTRDFDKVKDYILENPGATMLEVADQTGVLMKFIEIYLREGRLEIPENSPIFIKCEMCKKDIRFGRVCPECAEKLTQKKKEEMNFDEYQIGEPPKKIGKMRFIERERK